MTMKISVSSSDPRQSAADLLVVGVAQGAARKGLAGQVAKAIGAAANRAIKRAEFTGKKGQLVTLPGGGKLKAGKVALVGIGKAGELTHAAFRCAVAKAARFANGAKCSSMAVALPPDGDWVQAAAEGAVFGAYRYEQFKTGDRLAKYKLGRVSLLLSDKVTPANRAAADLGQRIADATCLARDLINTPPNELYPEALANFAKQVARDNKKNGLSCTVLGPKQLKDKGMNLLTAVGQGSSRGPRLAHMVYRPPGNKDKLKKLVFVGKGLTFDTGGICLKPAPGMEEMKGDMGGAANVVAMMAAVAATQPQAEIHGIIASAENMPDGNSYRPGDVFKSYEGKTVEIINTDAEGRLALADALHYAVELEPDFLLDNATLTGACVVALGPTVSGYYSNRDELADKIGEAAKDAGEAMWHMPLVENLRDMLKSDWADVKHMGDRWGGSITAALFLQEFVANTPWIHVDIAGPSMANKNYDIYSKGGTGHGVLTYLQLIDKLIADD